jgi:pimeloyl-ACP methyl ester carboxylesterase
MADLIEQLSLTITSSTAELNGDLIWFYRQQTPVGIENSPTVLFLHGVPTTSLSWTGVIPPVAAAGWRSIAPDWIGLGGSSKPNQRDFAYTPAAYLAALTAFIETMQIGKLAIVAQGFLGTIGIQYALQNPDKIDRLSIVGAPMIATKKLPWPLQQLNLPWLGEVLCQDPLMSEKIMEKGCQLVIEEEFLAQYRRPFLKSSDAGFALLAIVRNLQIAAVTTEISQGLAQATFPVQLIWGAKDPWLSIEQAQTAVKSIPKGELFTIAEAAHYPQEHCYPQLSEVLINFLKRSVF